MSSFAEKAPSRTILEGASATEEEDLLASLNASLYDHSKYESNVLRHATHSLAPPLLDLAAAATTETTRFITPDGFPDLSGLGTNDLTVLYTALEETRRKIKHQADKTENDSVRLLYMKEQILLSYLLSLGADQAVCLHEERSNEQARARLLLQQEHQWGASSLSESILAEKTQPQQPQQTHQRKRIPIMKRKRIEIEGGHNDDKKEETMALSKEELLMLKELRQERRQRREARRRQIAQFSSDDAEEEFLDDEVGQPTINRKDGSIAENNQATADHSSQNATTVYCPLCQHNVQISSGLSVEDVDAALSEHMCTCQNQRRSTRQRLTRAAATTTATLAAASSTSAGNNRKNGSLQSLDVGTCSHRTRNESYQPPFRTTVLTAVDDIEESAYEDRIDDWIEHGLDRMAIMKERDDSDILPGAEEYPGGLFIPEWMNNRLFAYQREGLHWLWELHQQRLGGVVSLSWCAGIVTATEISDLLVNIHFQHFFVKLLDCDRLAMKWDWGGLSCCWLLFFLILSRRFPDSFFICSYA